MSIHGFETPKFVIMLTENHGDTKMVLMFDVAQRESFERFCNYVMGTLHFDLKTSMMKAMVCVVEALGGITLPASRPLGAAKGAVYDMLLAFKPEHMARLVPATQEQIDLKHPIEVKRIRD